MEQTSESRAEVATETSTPAGPTPHERLAALVGDWEGEARTWYEPDVLGLVQRWRGSIRLALGGLFAVHEYTGTSDDGPHLGMAFIGFNRFYKRYEMAWIDNGHNGTAIMFATGGAPASAPSVLGSYPDPSGGPDWGWRTTFEMPDSDTLVITAYNITPAGEEAKAIETIYKRQG